MGDWGIKAWGMEHGEESREFREWGSMGVWEKGGGFLAPRLYALRVSSLSCSFTPGVKRVLEADEIKNIFI